jgi:hypothetical protein
MILWGTLVSSGRFGGDLQWLGHFAWSLIGITNQIIPTF